MNSIKKENGITLIALIVTIIVLMILSGITINEGISLIGNAKMESIMTNMITLKSRVKVLTEESNSKVWDLAEGEKSSNLHTIFINDYKMNDDATLNSEQSEQVSSELTGTKVCYKLTDEAVEIMAFTGADAPENYILVFDSNDYDKMDIIYAPGINYEGEVLYSLSYMNEKKEK